MIATPADDSRSMAAKNGKRRRRRPKRPAKKPPASRSELPAPLPDAAAWETLARLPERGNACLPSRGVSVAADRLLVPSTVMLTVPVGVTVDGAELDATVMVSRSEAPKAGVVVVAAMVVLDASRELDLVAVEDHAVNSL